MALRLCKCRMALESGQDIWFKRNKALLCYWTIVQGRSYLQEGVQLGGSAQPVLGIDRRSRQAQDPGPGVLGKLVHLDMKKREVK